MYSDIFCKVYNEFGWNYYPEVFGETLLEWLRQQKLTVRTALDLACGTGILCEMLQNAGIEASGMDLSEGMIRIARERTPDIHYDIADMTTYRPSSEFDLVTCTGDAVNHIAELADVEKIFQNVYTYTAHGGYFIFDLLSENEISTSEPFEMDFTDSTRVWFQMTTPEEKRVNLKIKVYENGEQAFEENIRETVHDPDTICALLRKCGFTVVRCADQLLDHTDRHGTTWFIVAKKE